VIAASASPDVAARMSGPETAPAAHPQRTVGFPQAPAGHESRAEQRRVDEVVRRARGQRCSAERQADGIARAAVAVAPRDEETRERQELEGREVDLRQIEVVVRAERPDQSGDDGSPRAAAELASEQEAGPRAEPEVREQQELVGAVQTDSTRRQRAADRVEWRERVARERDAERVVQDLGPVR